MVLVVLMVLAVIAVVVMVVEVETGVEIDVDVVLGAVVESSEVYIFLGFRIRK